MRYLSVHEVLLIYAEIGRVSPIERSDVRNIDGLESALAQPQQTFDGADLYPSISEKAAALLYSLCQNHPFVDGNKRLAFIAARQFMRENGFDLTVSTPEAIELMYAVARGEHSTAKIAAWIERRIRPFDSD